MAEGIGGANQDGNFDVNCRDIRDAQVVQNQQNFYGDASQSYQKAAEKLKRLEERTGQILDLSCKHGYVETEGLKACMNVIANKGVCFIVGWMGTGKTALGHEVLRRHRNSMRPLLLDRPEDTELIHDHLCKDKPFIIYFDDVFSDINPNGTFTSWRELFTNLWYEVQNGRVKLLMSFRQTAFPLMRKFLDKCNLFKFVLTVSLDKTPPTDKEMVSIFRNMLAEGRLASHTSPYGVKKAASQVNALGFAGCCELFCSTAEYVPLVRYICQQCVHVQDDSTMCKATKTNEENSIWEDVKMLARNFVLEKLEGGRKTEETVEKHEDETVRKWNYYLDIHDNTVLHYIVNRGGDENSLSVVLSRDVSQFINSQNSMGQIALLLAVSKKQVKAVQMLLQKGCDATLCDAKGWTATHYAADQQSPEMLQILSDHNALTLQGSPTDGATPLHIAVKRKEPEMALFLLMAADDVNAKDFEDNTFLHHAVRAHSSNFLKTLSIVHKFEGLHGEDLVRALDKEGIHIPLEKTELIQKQLKQVDPNMKNKTERTPIAEASFEHSEATQILLDLGADETLADADGNTPLLHAIQAGNSVTPHQLLKRSVISVFLKNNAGDTPLILALRMKMAETVKKIIRSHADVTEGDSEGNTPLMLAVSSGDEDLVKWMLKRPQCQATLSAQNKAGETAMDFARRLEDDAILKSLAQLCVEETSDEDA